jgi:hypothetical protein
MLRYRTGHNSAGFFLANQDVLFDRWYEPGGGESLTVPDQAVSIRELYARSSRADDELYRSDAGELLEDLPFDWETMDTFEKIEYTRDAARRLDTMRVRLARQHEEEEEAKRKPPPVAPQGTPAAPVPPVVPPTQTTL